MGPKKKVFFQTVVFIILYVLLGNARSVQENPVIPGATIAVNMIIPVLAGILFGRIQGTLVGFFGTMLNAFSPAGNVFEFLAILPHAIMGFAAGSLRNKLPTPLIACSLFIGHALNILTFTIFGLLDIGSILSGLFWTGLSYEIFIGIVTIVILKGIYNLGIAGKHGTHH